MNDEVDIEEMRPIESEDGSTFGFFPGHYITTFQPRLIGGSYRSPKIFYRAELDGLENYIIVVRYDDDETLVKIPRTEITGAFIERFSKKI